MVMEVKGEMQPNPKGPPCPPSAPRRGHAEDKCEYVVRQLGMAWLLWLLVRHHLGPCLPWESKRGAGVSEPAECVLPQSPLPHSSGPVCSSPYGPPLQPLAQEWSYRHRG